MKANVYENKLYKEIGIYITYNSVKALYLTIDLWWWYIEIQFNKEREDGE